MGIEELRSEIDQIDEALIRLIWKRIGIAERIGEAKKQVSLPVHDVERERKVVQRWKSLEPVAIEIMKLSRRVQVTQRQYQKPAPG